MRSRREYSRLGYYKCKHQSTGRKISVINIFTSAVNIYGVFSFTSFHFRFQDSMNNGASERLEFYPELQRKGSMHTPPAFKTARIKGF